MKWVIFVMMATTQDQGAWEDVYVFQKPTFDTYEECKEYVLSPKNIPDIANHLIAEYGFRLIQDLKCVPENKVREYILEEQEA